MDLWKSKRGSEYFSLSWNVIVRFIVVFVIVFIPVYMFIMQVTTSNYFEKNYLALDLAILADTLMASPNDLIFNYNKNTQDFSFDVRKNEISVYNSKNGIIIGSVAKSSYIENPSIKVYYDEMSPLFTFFENKDEPESVIPVKLSMIKAGDTIRFYNSKEDLVDE